jgi:hypothetical protein
VSQPDDRAFVRSLPVEVIEFAFQVYEEGFAEVERLQKLKADGTTEEKAKAAQQLEQLGVPRVWFWRRVDEKYPGFTDAQMLALFGWVAHASLF